jgi:hypothetical protein
LKNKLYKILNTKRLPLIPIGSLFFGTLLFANYTHAQEVKIVREAPFIVGETVTYTIIYNWGFIWVNAGEVTFTVDTATMMKKNCYHFRSAGKSYPQHDWFYKVRDRYESYIDYSTYAPLRFLRDVHEGKNVYYEENIYDYKNNRILSLVKHPKKESKKDTIPLQATARDVLSMIYYARLIDFSQYKTNDTIPLKIVLDNEIHTSYIRIIGREQKKVPDLGSFDCVVFKPLLVEGSIFKGGENMTVWVTDDELKIPVFVETPIIVGNIKSHVTSYSGLKVPLKESKTK